MSVRVTNIQRMCFDDGPGIRTTVFMKGCSIHCPWCSNPENISFEKQRIQSDGGFGNGYSSGSGNGYSGGSDNRHSGESGNGYRGESGNRHSSGPGNGYRGESDSGYRGGSGNGYRGKSGNGYRGESGSGYSSEYGIDYEPEELVRILGKDRKFWGCDGGVTFSGGEALMQARQLEDVWRRLKKDCVHLAVETALFVPLSLLETAAQYIDFYYVDVKLLEKELCASVLGGDAGQYRENIEYLASRQKDICFRVPCSKEYVLQGKNQKMLLNFFKEYRQYPVEIFPLHDLGRKKYQSLGLEMPDFEKAAAQDLEDFQAKLSQEGCHAEIINI